MPGDPTLIGTVQDVKGATISVLLNEDTASGISFVEGHGYRIGQVGSFVRVPLGYTDLFGIVTQTGAGAVPETLVEVEPYGRRWMTAQLVGEGARGARFERGVSQHPTVGDSVHLVTQQDLWRIYGRPEEPRFVRVGHLASAEAIPALVDVNKLVTRHVAVLGATGAGKSTTVAGLVHTLSDVRRYPSARVIVIDIHGEYASALRERARVFRIAPQSEAEYQLCVPYWAMTFDELMTVTLGSLDDASRGFVLQKVAEMKRSSLERASRDGVTVDSLTVDSAIPFSIHQLWYDLFCEVSATHIDAGNHSRDTWALLLDGQGTPVDEGDVMSVRPPRFRLHTQEAGKQKVYLSRSTLNIRRPVEGLGSRLRDPMFDFLFRPGPWLPSPEGLPEQDLDILLQSWIGADELVTILDLSGVSPSILTHIVGVVLRILYDALFWARDLSEGGRERPVLVVLEEGHSYLGSGDEGPAATAVRRIVKEGRKYGIGAMVVSQRPSEIDATILSQCGTLVVMRLSNAVDRAHVVGAVTDNMEGLLGMLPILRTGEAIVIGEAVHLPMRVLVDLPPADRRPDSADAVVYDSRHPGGWNRNREPSDYTEVVRVWRAQRPRSERIRPDIQKIPVEPDNEGPE